MIRTETHRRLAWCVLYLTGFGFLILQLAIFFVLGVRARPWWGLPQSVAVGVICPYLIFLELKRHSDLYFRYRSALL